MTEDLMGFLRKKNTDSLWPLLVRRQRCAEEVERNDALLLNAAKSSRGKASISPHLVQIECILSIIASLDQELVAGIREETAALKEELLKLCSARAATNSYRDCDRRIPRFVDVDG